MCIGSDNLIECRVHVVSLHTPAWLVAHIREGQVSDQIDDEGSSPITVLQFKDSEM